MQGDFKTRSLALPQEALLDVPQPLAEVHIVPVGVLEALHLVPEGVHLLPAVGLNLLQAGALIDQLPPWKTGTWRGLTVKSV